MFKQFFSAFGGVLLIAVIGYALISRITVTPSSSDAAPTTSSAKFEGDTQIISLSARGGYSPEIQAAKGGVPTILRISTKNTFDCSSAIVIPALGVNETLGPSTTRDFTISAEKAHGTLRGSCAMGMYSFEIQFDN